MIDLLLIDDHMMFLDGLRHTLMTYDFIHNIHSCDRATKALKLLEQYQVDLIITDLSMPELNGIEFIQLVKKKHPNIKILVVSMFTNQQLNNGLDGYIKKESSEEELIRAIRAIGIEGKTYFQAGLGPKKSNLPLKNTLLTRREKEIVYYLAHDLSAQEIADKLFIAKSTVEVHKKNIFQKLDVRSSAGLIHKAFQLGIINWNQEK